MEDVEILCKTLQFDNKLFYFDLKENPRGRYLKISEKTSATRSTIIVPANGIAWFLDLFDYYINADDRDLFSKELKLDNKVFYFDVGENKRGRFLKSTDPELQSSNSDPELPSSSLVLLPLSRGDFIFQICSSSIPLSLSFSNTRSSSS